MTAEPIASAPPRAPARPRLAAVPTARVPAAYVPTPICVCGHEPDAHGDDGPETEHTVCVVCGPVRCRAYRRRTGRAARRR